MFLYGNEVTNIILRNVNHADYPHYVNASVSCAKFINGPWLTDDELDTLEKKMHENGTMQEMCAGLLCGV